MSLLTVADDTFGADGFALDQTTSCGKGAVSSFAASSLGQLLQCFSELPDMLTCDGGQRQITMQFDEPSYSVVKLAKDSF